MLSLETEALMQKMRAAMMQALSLRSDDYDALIQSMMELCRETLGVNRVTLWMFERGQQRIAQRKMASDGEIGQTPTSIDRAGHENYFAALSQSFVIDAHHAHSDERTEPLAREYLIPFGIQSMLDVPVRSIGHQLGVMCIESKRQRNWHPFEQSFANGIATQISLLMERDELAQANRAIVQRVLYDDKTQLPNFLYADDRLRQELGELERHQDLGVVLIHADIEQFLLICNSLGQAVAQDLLANLAERLANICQGRFVARSGDDDFVVIFRSSNSEQDALALCQRIIAEMNVPLRAGQREVLCALALGYAIRKPGDGAMNAEIVFREAWTASRAARRSGIPRAFERSLLVQVALEVELEQALRSALIDDSFEPHFQPIVHLDSAKIVGFEALMRWRHEGRVLLPVEFIAVAQRTGLIVPIGQALVKRTIAEFARLQKANPSETWHLHINLSPPEFLRDGLVADVCELLARYQVKPEMVGLEITESVVIEDMQKAQRVIQQLQQFGIKVFLDDLGTGYSSLNYLRALPVDGIKLDYSFTNDIERNPRSFALVQALAQLSTQLRQITVAEGVEWETQMQALAKAGMQSFQGFLFAKATPSAEITARWIHELEQRLSALHQAALNSPHPHAA
jgi:diguanylate cyclase (GGDEF)-like protein